MIVCIDTLQNYVSHALPFLYDKPLRIFMHRLFRWMLLVDHHIVFFDWRRRITFGMTNHIHVSSNIELCSLQYVSFSRPTSLLIYRMWYIHLLGHLLDKRNPSSQKYYNGQNHQPNGCANVFLLKRYSVNAIILLPHHSALSVPVPKRTLHMCSNVPTPLQRTRGLLPSRTFLNG